MLFSCPALLVLLLLFQAPGSSAEVLEVIEFDLSSLRATDTGFRAEDAVAAWLEAPQLKWLRYHRVLLASTGSEPVPMRVAHLMFKSPADWAVFQEEHKGDNHALFDHFWLHSRRLLLQTVEPAVPFQKRQAVLEQPGGWVYALRYTVRPEAREEFRRQWARLAPFFAKECEGEGGFLQRRQYSAAALTKAGQEVVFYEFTGMGPLAAVMFGRTHLNIVETLKPLCGDWRYTVLSPGGQNGLYYPGAGADKEPETL